MNQLLIKMLIVTTLGSAPAYTSTDVIGVPVSTTASHVHAVTNQQVVEIEDLEKYNVEENINSEDISKDDELSQVDDGQSPLEQEETQSEEVSEPVEPELKEPEIALSDSGYPLVEKYSTNLPGGMFLNLKYDKHLPAYDYVLLNRSRGNIRQEPTTRSKIVRTAAYFEKLNIIESVKGQYISSYGTDIWYKVFWYKDGKMQFGYMLSSLGQRRNFQFDKMKSSMDLLKGSIDNSDKMGYISNYKNRAGKPPLYKGSTLDKFGNLRDQSAPAYYDLDNKSEFIYLGDGTLFSIIEERGSYYRVKSLDYDESLWVPKKYVYTKNAPTTLSQVVVVDRKNQNEAVFEWTDLGWQMISYSFATTGANAKYKFETPLGYFMAIERKSKFLYLDDITKEIAGYAPYAIRFTGGAYIHGVPVDYIKTDDQLIDPGHKETLYTLGTVPRSHKCVRNFTSHAQFLYNWVKIGQASVIVIE